MEHAPSLALSEAAAYLSSASSLAKVSNTTKLELYGLYKYLTVASVPQNPRPSLFDLTGRAKWDAWNSIGKQYARHGADAERRYLEVAQELGWVSGSGIASGPREEGEIWDEDLGVNISLKPTAGKEGMGGSVSVMPATPEKDDAGGQTLHGFAIQGNEDKITQLLAANPVMDVNLRDEYGYTALHLACDRGNLLAVKALIKHGADATIKDPDDLTGMELAAVAGHDEICAFLQTKLH